MPFNLNFQSPTESTTLQIDTGEILFLLGANGVGKSSMMFHFARQNHGRTRRISAHRQTWMASDALDMTPAAKMQTEQHIQQRDIQHESRYKDNYAAQRASMVIYDIIDSENIRARTIAAAVDSKNISAALEAAKAEAPIAIINELLQQSNIPITISIQANERIMAVKANGQPYSAAELSDGERNALLIAGNVLTAPQGTLILIDEPERHLHRSIICPLLSQLFERRQDCAFVVSTHDHDLPLEVPKGRTLLLRSCTFNGQNVRHWEADELPTDAQIDDQLKRDLIGARRKILFIEGTESSLDKPLYSLIFPMVSIIPKGNCREVEQAVSGCKAGEPFHWIKAYGIADGDGFGSDQVAAKLDKGVYAIPYYSVEAIYFHTYFIEQIASKQAELRGEDATSLTQRALNDAVSAIANDTQRLSQKVAKKAARKLILEMLPADDQLLSDHEVSITNSGPDLWEQRKKELDMAVAERDWQRILLVCPVRESGALHNIATALGFQKREDYEKAVRQLLAKDADSLAFARDLFGDLYEQLSG